MNFKLKSLKVKDVDGVDYVEAKAETPSGVAIGVSVPVKDIPGLETVEQDVTRVVKKKLREDLQQLSLLDENDKHKPGEKS